MTSKHPFQPQLFCDPHFATIYLFNIFLVGRGISRKSGKSNTRQLQSSLPPAKYKPIKKVCVFAIQLETLRCKTLVSAKPQWLVQGEQHQMLKHKEPL